MNQESPTAVSLEGLVYPHPNLTDHTLDDNDLERNCPLDLGRHHVQPRHDLGALDGLPLEILSAILVDTPLRSLMEFRRVNQRAMQVVDSIPQFQTCTRYTLAPLRGILSINAGSHTTCQDLFRALITSKCEECEDFAGFIYLLDCTRVCLLCFSEKQRYVPLSSAEVLRHYGLNRGRLASLIGMRSVPGCYSPNEKTVPARLELFDQASARHAGIQLYGSAVAMEQHTSQTAARKFEKRRASSSGRPASTPARGNPRSSFAKRFMAVVRAPTVDVSIGSVEWGFHCLGCKRQYRKPPLHWRRKYTIQTFEEHVRECGPIVDGEHVLPSRGVV
ncbi:uncharacterized protein RCC_07383 [Ramularia collo-cygni]|uniref:F-box domain-containing protein n=1 Tax=Ramularia collo-cygni TaxID=112498 RepID=A0A2D3V7V0_9PEZI|nr:uncharacterized protein RCC_07383 [Ramularia collo-cygni]CZT21520.1 uncharacterized protein RCC_07383 [Ramularia collo-cygni]